MSDSTQGQTLFERMYTATKESLDAAKKPFIERSLKRRFEAAWDDCENKKIDAQVAIQSLSESIKDYDLNGFLAKRQIVKDAVETQNAIVEHYKEMFGEDLKRG